MEKLPFYEVDFKQDNPYLAIAYIVLNENDLKIYKDALKPNRGTVVSS